jgi:hypothetical protein
MAKTQPNAAPVANPVADALDAINELAGKAELFEAHGQVGVLRVKIQELVAKAKAAL